MAGRLSDLRSRHPRGVLLVHGARPRGADAIAAVHAAGAPGCQPGRPAGRRRTPRAATPQRRNAQRRNAEMSHSVRTDAWPSSGTPVPAAAPPPPGSLRQQASPSGSTLAPDRMPLAPVATSRSRSLAARLPASSAPVSRPVTAICKQGSGVRAPLAPLGKTFRPAARNGPLSTIPGHSASSIGAAEQPVDHGNCVEAGCFVHVVVDLLRGRDVGVPEDDLRIAGGTPRSLSRDAVVCHRACRRISTYTRGP